MKLKHVIMLLVLLAWPLYYLYQRQLGAISFLLLAILFLYLTIKEIKDEKERNSGPKKKGNGTGPAN
ncbi:hypothetical protein DRW41_06350 [Neobacillus piezotolerans]|uniref:Uncharacterized protein n=1 Tax=Neobacillus piezotolerans TaxID=2259171 RepID=A0A3D8GSK9_9BACI|nr:hypothetical protein [Neobacillus piezotolerans]RDU37464.1 hypothetical protein DRW41_06350 [Neobacillus piezotolerans]